MQLGRCTTICSVCHHVSISVIHLLYPKVEKDCWHAETDSTCFCSINPQNLASANQIDSSQDSSA